MLLVFKFTIKGRNAFSIFFIYVHIYTKPYFSLMVILLLHLSQEGNILFF